MNDILEWIAKYPAHAFVTGCFVVVGLAIVCDFFVRIVRSITGKYPAPSVVQCDADNPCYCCREGACDSDCRCFPEEKEEEDVA